jgi:hypothetical protein
LVGRGTVVAIGVGFASAAAVARQFHPSQRILSGYTAAETQQRSATI